MDVTPAIPKCTSTTPNPVVGDPVVVLDGSNIQSAADYASADGRFKIERMYRSFYASTGLNAVYGLPVGATEDWRFGFEIEVHVASDGSGATIHLPDGTAYDFTRTGNAFAPKSGSALQTRYSLAFSGTAPADWTSVVNATSNWTVVDTIKNQVWTFQTFNSPVNSYTPVYEVARPLRMIQAAGYQLTYSYDSNGTLQSIVDSYGRTFGFTWNYYPYPSNDPTTNAFYYKNVPATISQISLPGGGKLQYTYNPPVDGSGAATALNEIQLVRAELDDASGAVVDFTTYQYANATYADLITSITDARGIVRETYGYDALGRVVSVQGASGQNSFSFAYNTASTTLPNELVRTVTNPLGKVTEYHWAHPANTNLTQLTSIIGDASPSCSASASAYTYDANGFVASETDAENRVTSYVRDAQARPTTITRGAGTAQSSTTTIVWDATYNAPDTIIEPGITTTQTIAPATGLVTQIRKQDTTTQTSPYSTAGQTRTWAYTYDSTGRLATVVGPVNNATTTYAYDPTGFLKSVTNELGQVTNVTSANARGQPTSITDPNGIVTALAYDGHGWLTSVSVDTANTPAVTTIAYDPVGDITSIIDPIGVTQTFAYDNAQRLTGVTNSAGEVVTYVRDAMGNATSVTIAKSGPTTTYSKARTFDELGRIIKEVGAVSSNSSYQFGYDRTDNMTSVTDPRSNVFSRGFDALNRLISETDESNATVTLTRNGVDAITSYKDPRSITTTYIRNGFGEIIEEISPDKGTTIYVRDARGLVTQRTDPRGVVTSYTYDNAGRLTNVAAPNPSQYYTALTWDVSGGGNYGIGRLTDISDESGVEFRVFDTKGNVTRSYRTTYPMTSAVLSSYTYDLAGNITSLTLPSGQVITYQRDTLGRITGITGYPSSSSTSSIPIVSSVTWNPYGPIQSVTYGNGLVETFTTDTDDRIKEVKITSPSATVDDRVLTWMGDTLTGINDSVLGAFSENFTYTATNHLASATGSYGTFAWTYDAVGNRTSEQLGSALSTYAYPSNTNRLSSITPAAAPPRGFTYDAAGDIVTDSRSGALGLTYQYDVDGRLSKAFQTNAPANGATYAYDARGRLASRTVTQSAAPTTTTTLYLYDLADHIIAETDTGGVTQREYIWLDDLPVAVVDGVNTASQAIYYVATDHLMRPVLMTDQSQSWAWYAAYKPFGETATLVANPAVMNARFPGQWFQLETGLAYNWHRHYDPTIGRYIQPDPLLGDDGAMTIGGLPADVLAGNHGGDGHAVARSMGWKTAHDIIMRWPSSRAMFADGPSIYGYAEQNPTGLTDPTGNGAVGNFIRACGLVFGFVTGNGLIGPAREDCPSQPPAPPPACAPASPPKKPKA